MSIQESVGFLCPTNEELEIKIKILFMIASKIKKFIEIDFTKDMQCLKTERAAESNSDISKQSYTMFMQRKSQ